MTDHRATAHTAELHGQVLSQDHLVLSALLHSPLRPIAAEHSDGGEHEYRRLVCPVLQVHIGPSL